MARTGANSDNLVRAALLNSVRPLRHTSRPSPPPLQVILSITFLATGFLVVVWRLFFMVTTTIFAIGKIDVSAEPQAGGTATRAPARPPPTAAEGDAQRAVLVNVALATIATRTARALALTVAFTHRLADTPWTALTPLALPCLPLQKTILALCSHLDTAHSSFLGGLHAHVSHEAWRFPSMAVAWCLASNFSRSRGVVGVRV